MITNIDALLALFQDTITRNYQESQMTINLIFMTNNIMNWLIQKKTITTHASQILKKSITNKTEWI